MSEELLRQALAWAGRGWHVFPCAPGAKPPAFRGEDWQDLSTTDPSRIERWWRSRPFSIGIDCGKSALTVLDLDVPGHGRNAPGEAQRQHTGTDTLLRLCARHGKPMPDATFAVRTPSGGRHLYYAAPAIIVGSSWQKLGQLVDVRGAGGYVIAAGSTIGSRTYTVADPAPLAPFPSWIAELHERPQPLAQQRRIQRQVLPQRPGVQRVQPPRQPRPELGRLGADGAGQGRVLVLQVPAHERPHPVRHQPQRQGLDQGGLARAGQPGHVAERGRHRDHKVVDRHLHGRRLVDLRAQRQQGVDRGFGGQVEVRDGRLRLGQPPGDGPPHRRMRNQAPGRAAGRGGGRAARRAGRRCRPASAELLQVAAGHPALRPGAVDQGDVDAVLAR